MGKPKKNWDYLVDYEGNYVGGTGGGGTGPQGLPGVKGAQGPTGPKGNQGIQGVQGATGPTATGAFVFKGNVADASGLPTTAAVGDAYVQQDINQVVVWDGSSLTGQGAANTTVAKGEPGLKGPQGDKGVVGTNGVKGVKGATGPAGALPLISTLPVLP